MNKVFIIAEAGVNHNGKLDLALKLVDVAKYAGADAIKFQTFKTEKIISKFAEKAEYQKNNSAETQFEMVKKLELTYDNFKIIEEYCKQKKIIFLSTPDDVDSLNFLVSLNVPYIKIGSTEITNHFFLSKIGSTKIPIILSTGMSDLDEVKEAIDVIKRTGNFAITLLHCTTGYPAALEEVNLKAMVTLKNKFNLDVGFSDHTIGYESGIAAVVLGAKIIEKHFTIDKNMFGPDHKASLNPIELKEFVKKIRNTEMLLGTGIKQPTLSEIKIKKVVRRSIVASKNLSKGHILECKDIEFKRPGTGIEPFKVNKILGKTLNRNILKDEMILEKYLV